MLSRVPTDGRSSEPGPRCRATAMAETDSAAYALLSPCWATAYCPGDAAMEPDHSSEDLTQTLSAVTRWTRCRIEPWLVLALRSVLFLTAIALMGAIGLSGLHLLISL